MTYDSPFSAFEGEVIPEVASFKEEGLVTPEGSEGEKGKLVLRAYCPNIHTIYTGSASNLCISQQTLYYEVQHWTMASALERPYDKARRRRRRESLTMPH